MNPHSSVSAKGILRPDAPETSDLNVSLRFIPGPSVSSSPSPLPLILVGEGYDSDGNRPDDPVTGDPGERC